MDVDREASKLWKVYRTVKEMVKDRVGQLCLGRKDIAFDVMFWRDRRSKLTRRLGL